MVKPRIIVEVDDGMVYVYCDRPSAIDLIIVDYDTEGVGDTDQLCEIDGQPVVFRDNEVDGFSDGTEDYWLEAHEQKPYKLED